MTHRGASPRPPEEGRPRLAEHVAVRRHVIAGQECLVLHDTLQERVAIIGVREWALLRCADGTRDLDGIIQAAAYRGHFAGTEQLAAFVSELDAAGMLASKTPLGRESVSTRSNEPSEADGACVARADAPLDLLEGFRLECDGRGTCCRFYPTTVFSPLESARARSLCSEALDEGWDEERVFTPERGSTFRRWDGREQGRCVTVVDGRCVYLAADNLCMLQRASEQRAKPLGCQLFPASFVDDGEAIRVSVAPECACVFASVGSGRGEPLVPQGSRTGADLDPGVFVRQLPESIPLTAERRAERAAYVRWSRRVARHFGERVAKSSTASALEHERAAPGQPDPLDALWALAETVRSAGLDWPSTLRALESPAPVPQERLAPWLSSLDELLSRRLPHDVAWRSERDLARQTMQWLQRACATLLDEARVRATEAQVAKSTEGCSGASASRAWEAFYLQALFHGHQLLEHLPLVAALRDRAMRLALARALSAILAEEGRSADDDPALAYPLALVEAVIRGYGLHGYAVSAAWGLTAPELGH